LAAAGEWGAIMKLLLVLASVVVVALFVAFGTLSPCGMLRETERKQDSLAAILPDGIVDVALAAKYGSLTPGKCVGLLLNGRGGPASAPVAATSQPQLRIAARPPELSATNNLNTALQRMDAPMGECRDKRLNGELKSHVESALCSNPRFEQAFSAANYPYMDLVNFVATKRLEIARKEDQSQLTEEQGAAEMKKLMAQIAEIEKTRNSQRN
jgi:hypothetical protein